ncbi:MAG: 50S ribosomal protein L24 [Leptospirales bacterium]|nr:50S ribosomal protein L24 [Leptospirales bacterium]
MKETITSTKLKKDDEVIVVAGSQKGKRGKIMALDIKKARVVVQGVNRVKRFQRPSQENPKGGTVELEQSMPISNIMFYDSKAKKGVRLGYKIGPDGKKVRVTRPDGREV